jgi:hypothetical protein
MHRLPADILVQILAEATLTERAERKQEGEVVRPRQLQGFRPPLYIDAPSALSQTCSHWRRAALGCLSLWTALEVINSVVYDKRRYKLWLERSGDVAPLDMIFHFSDPSPDFCILPYHLFPRVTRLLDLLELTKTNSGRLKDVVLTADRGVNFSPETDPTVLITNLDVPMPKVVVQRICGRRWDFYTTRYMKSFPSMRELELVDVELQWEQICSALDAMGSTLQSLILDIPCFTDELETGSVRLPSLRNLSVRVRCCGETMNLNALNAPALIRLAIEIYYNGQQMFNEPAYDLIESLVAAPENFNLSNLQNLSLCGLIGEEIEDPDAISQFYDLLDSITVLRLNFDRVPFWYYNLLSNDDEGDSDEDEGEHSQTVRMQNLEHLEAWVDHICVYDKDESEAHNKKLQKKKEEEEERTLWEIKMVVEQQREMKGPLKTLKLCPSLYKKAQSWKHFTALCEQVDVAQGSYGYIIPADHPYGGIPDIDFELNWEDSVGLQGLMQGMHV